MRATELQFARLLKDAAGSLDVRLRLFSLRNLPRGEQARVPGQLTSPHGVT